LYAIQNFCVLDNHGHDPKQIILTWQWNKLEKSG
jgi:hypothetical protein